MKARFTDSIASARWSYGQGQEVAVSGSEFLADTVPEYAARGWLASGLLESVESTESAANAATQPRKRTTRSHTRRQA